MFLIIFLAVVCTILLNFLVVRKLTNKTYKFCINSLNIIILIIFIGLISAVGIIKNNLNKFIDVQIGLIENRANEIYPNALDLQMSTAEIKSLLEQSLTYESEGKIEDIVSNVIKSNISDYTSFALRTIKKLERTEDKLSVKEALVSLKEICIDTVKPYYKFAYAAIIIVFCLYLGIIILLCRFLFKNQKSVNSSIVFGDEASSTEMGMKI